MKKLSISFMVLSLIGCATMGRQMNPEQSSYLSKALTTPKELIIKKDKSEEAWGRAQTFISRFSDMKLQIATDYVLETYNPAGTQIGFKANKTPMGDKVKVQALCFYSNENPLISSDIAKRAYVNANVFRYYILTGEEPPPDLLAQIFNVDTSANSR